MPINDYHILNLACNGDHFFLSRRADLTVSGKSKSDCLNKARNEFGWVIARNGRCYCPKHARKKKKRVVKAPDQFVR